ncbi:hypothetical protein [Limnovirga soli]|uniref:Uncharacterized protein n=1 Tax=Limnovirga soli TaxID=2656915 RepID=A0A8J8FBL9_9BACT|nr:hypothetical protein [Limnovirga soli]NNV54745.1 hypothetical protein [Limnovirga soli]
MTFTPHISIYPEGKFDYEWLGDNLTRATLIFSKNLDYNKNLVRKRVNIHLGDEVRAHTEGSIKSIWIKNTIDTSLVLTDVAKIEIVLKIIYDAVITIAEFVGWDGAGFEKAYRLSLADKGKFIWHSQIKANKNRTIKARIKISLDKDGRVPIIAEFFDNKLNQQFEVGIIDTFLHFVDWERVFEKPVWFGNEKFGFSFYNSQLLILANSTLRHSEIVIAEKSWSREEVEGGLKRLTFRHFANDKEMIEWASE